MMNKERVKEHMKLSDRLELVLAAVKPAECAADIGTDHGFVPVELVRRGIVSRALAMDVRPGPLSRAREHIAQAALGDRIETRLSDGLAKLLPGEANAVVMAGMGGELTIGILDRGRALWDTVDQWVLSPHSEIPKVRRFLYENGFAIENEAMVFDGGKYYTVMDVRREKADGVLRKTRSDSAFRYSPKLIRRRDPVLMRFLKEEEKKLEELCRTLSARAEDSPRAAEGLLEAERNLAYNREVQNEMQ